MSSSGKIAESIAPALTINGNYDHWQRVAAAVQTSTTTYSKSTSYAPDRMFTLPAGASVTQQRSTTVPDACSRYSCQINGAASVTTVDHGQRIKAGIMATRGLQSLVFTAYIRNESGAAFTPNLRIGTPGAVDDFTTVTNRLDQAIQSCADSAWTRVYQVFDPSAFTNIANGMELCLRIPSGSLVAGDVVRIAQFSIRPGLAVVPYVPPDDDAELLRSQPYYFRRTGTLYHCQMHLFDANVAYGTVFLPMTMRASPTIGHSTYTGWAINSGAGSHAITSGGITIALPGTSSVVVTTSTSGSPLAAKDAASLYCGNATDYMEFNSEL